MSRQVTSKTGPPVEIRALEQSELGAAAGILADGMLDNPMHVRVFGPDPVLRQQRLAHFLRYLVTYVHSNGEILSAYKHGDLIGVLGMIKPGFCRPALSDRRHFAAVFLPSFPPIVLLRIHRWLAAWSRNDLKKAHWHIGPLAVHPGYRRQGIGRQLMIHCCQRMDALKAIAWLETDLEINVAFYRTLGFAVILQESVLGVPNWFMSRPPK